MKRLETKPMQRSEQGMFRRAERKVDIAINACKRHDKQSHRWKYWNRIAWRWYAELDRICFLPYRIGECDKCGAQVGSMRHIGRDFHEVNGEWFRYCEACKINSGSQDHEAR